MTQYFFEGNYQRNQLCYTSISACFLSRKLICKWFTEKLHVHFSKWNFKFSLAEADNSIGNEHFNVEWRGCGKQTWNHIELAKLYWITIHRSWKMRIHCQILRRKALFITFLLTCVSLSRYPRSHCLPSHSLRVAQQVTASLRVHCSVFTTSSLTCESTVQRAPRHCHESTLAASPYSFWRHQKQKWSFADHLSLHSTANITITLNWP